eukprot:TRINITY_DN746_c0_g1_i1.p1 TRINITY_DN746_c0_g1~~TRINITY_DN746_c0_g1_i1.p1  ORF type:complete len:921 (-),score=86.05 TRINITY_DN746_c0_g1_i1:34-2796(-)
MEWSSSRFKYYSLLVIVALFLAAPTSAQTYFCAEALNPTAAPVCNTTALQSSLPTKICSFSSSPAFHDWTNFCTELGYDAWRSVCPKQNLNVEGFCSGGGQLGRYCNLQACTTDADCPHLLPVPLPPLLPCYDCCQNCFEDAYCDTQVRNGIYAARGNTTCLSCETTPTASEPVSTPLVAQRPSRIRFANAQMSDATHLGLAVSPFGPISGLDAFSSTGSGLPATGYLSLPLPEIPLNEATSFYLADLLSDSALTAPRDATLVENQSYTFIAVGPSDLANDNNTMPFVMFGVAEKPANSSLYAGQALVKVVNAVASSYGSRISLAISEGIIILYTQVSFGASTFFLPFNQQVDINVYLDGETLLIHDLVLHPDATTVIYLRGDLASGYRWSSTVVPFSTITPPVDPPIASPIAQPAICVGGFVESTGYCNCYSGFMNDIESQQYKCSVPPPSFCQPLSQVTPMENYVFPSIDNLHVSSNKLGLNIYSSFVADRRTLIEFPNPECNLINSPIFYTKVNNGCYDEFIVDAPFASCGFTKTSEIDQDIYRGEVHVKHIDRVTINGNTIDRIIDTPFAIVVRLPRTLAIQSSVEIVASPVFTVPVSAAFVGQKVDIATQTGQLEFVTSVPEPFIVVDVHLTNVPSGVNASIRIVKSDCEAGYCVQHLVVDLDILYCDISGVYSMVVSIGCTTQENCPAEVRNSPVTSSLTSTIIAQRTCGEAYVDVGLQGWLQAYSDPSFTDQDLSFGPDQPAYFLINAYSAEVDIAKVSVDAIYFYGPNVPGHFLLNNGTISSLGALNNFTWGQYSSTQAWFSIDVTVSPPGSNENTLFKLNNGESGVYNFVAIVEVEWTPDSTTPHALPTPVSSPSNRVKKRVVLQGTLPRQGAQFSAQVQIGTRKDDDVSGSSFLTISTMALLLSTLISLF